MMITDHQYGAEMLLTTGKAYTFDSIECMSAFQNAGSLDAQKIHSLWVTDFAAPGNLLNTADAIFLHSDNLRSPMGMNLSAYSNQATVAQQQFRFGGDIVEWPQLTQLVQAAWNNNRQAGHH